MEKQPSLKFPDLIKIKFPDLIKIAVYLSVPVIFGLGLLAPSGPTSNKKTEEEKYRYLTPEEAAKLFKQYGLGPTTWDGAQTIFINPRTGKIEPCCCPGGGHNQGYNPWGLNG